MIRTVVKPIFPCSLRPFLAQSILLSAMLVLVGCGSSHHELVRDRDATRHGSTTAQTRPSGASAGEYRVIKGDTLYGIAFRNGLDYQDLARWNGIASPYTIYAGQRLRLSPTGGVAAGVVSSAPSASARSSPPSNGIRFAQPPIASTPPHSPNVSTLPASVLSTPSAPIASAPTPVDSGTLKWRWPSDGSVVSTYQAGDQTRSGLDIADRSGQPVLAAADGEVVYSGNGLIGFGELIIVKHSNSLLSAYARNGKRLVQEHERVKAGQPIAEIGGARSLLHFEIRKNGKPINPLDYLPPR